MLDTLDAVARAHPGVSLGVYVDDANQFAAGPRLEVARRLAAAALDLGARMERDLLLEVSKAKSGGIASCPRLAKSLADALQRFGVTSRVPRGSWARTVPVGAGGLLGSRGGGSAR